MMEKKKTVLITGANRGIGLATARAMGERGYRVILTGRDVDRITHACWRLADEGLDVLERIIDLENEKSIYDAGRWMEDSIGYLTVLINNAAIHYDSGQSAISMDFEILQEALQTNLVAPWKMVDAFLPLLRKEKYSRIVNVSSGSGALHQMGGETPAYAVSKAALNVMTIKLAHALKPEGILVNAVDPGWVRTDMGGVEAPRSVAEGAASVVWAATLSEDGPTGGFFRDGKRIEW